MGRRKLEIKRIEDKSSRLVTFSKRRAGLIKKAKHLSDLCDVDVAVIVFSATDKLYEFCSGGTNSLESLISRFQRSYHEADGTKGDGKYSGTRFRTCKELLQTVDRLDEENNTKENSVAVKDMTQLEEELHDALVQIRSIKTQLMTEYRSTLQEKNMKLSEEKEELKQQVQVASVNKKNDVVEDGGGSSHDFATHHNHQNSLLPPQQLFTLPLFKD